MVANAQVVLMDTRFLRRGRLCCCLVLLLAALLDLGASVSCRHMSWPSREEIAHVANRNSKQSEEPTCKSWNRIEPSCVVALDSLTRQRRESRVPSDSAVNSRTMFKQAPKIMQAMGVQVACARRRLVLSSDRRWSSSMSSSVVEGSCWWQLVAFRASLGAFAGRR
jgi:hypothetical protein